MYSEDPQTSSVRAVAASSHVALGVKLLCADTGQ